MRDHTNTSPGRRARTTDATRRAWHEYAWAARRGLDRGDAVRCALALRDLALLASARGHNRPIRGLYGPGLAMDLRNRVTIGPEHRIWGRKHYVVTGSPTTGCWDLTQRLMARNGGAA